MLNKKDSSSKKINELAEKYDLKKDGMFYNRYRFL